MMGTGKTSVGRWLAHATGRTFIDTDELVAARAGASVDDIFNREGEPAFRTREAEAIASLAGTTGAVVATGGLAMADAGSRRVVDALGPVVVLTARPGTLAERLAESPRPSLPTPTEAGVAAALDARSGVYNSFPLHVATDGRTLEEVGAVVLDLVAQPGRADCLPVASVGAGYRVLIEPGLLERAGGLIDAALAPSHVFIVSDHVVAPLHLERLRDGFGRSARSRTTVALLPSGEAAKDLAQVHDLYEKMAAARLERTDLVVALGGGAVGDTAGFAAATYLRGVRVVQVPTTLLAMVDSSIGGKTGVDLGRRKNMVGAFHDPVLVLIDPGVLATMPAETVSEGMAEVIKAGLIGDADLFCDLEASAAANTPGLPGEWTDRLLARGQMADLIRRAITVKAAIVGRDPLEQGERAVLNLGHTFAHAFEAATSHRVTHGRAVAVGLVAACRLAARAIGTSPALAERVAAVVTHVGLPTSLEVDPDAVVAAMSSDKKRRGGRQRFVLPTKVGEVVITEQVDEQDLLSVIRSVTLFPPSA
jgi:3-dehydroquinate synthase